MKTKFISAFVFAASLPIGAGLWAQTTAPTLTSGAAAATVASQAAPTPSQNIYGSRLPSAQELTNAAAKQGIAIDKIDETSSQVVVVYKYADGQTKTVSYQLLPAGSSAPATVVASPSSPAPVVVYQTTSAPPPPVVYYYDDYPAYYPYYPRYGYGYPRVSLNFGVGFHGYSHGGGFYHGGGGGFHRGWR